MKQWFKQLILLSVSAVMLMACDRQADTPVAVLAKSEEGATSLSGADLFVVACQGCHNITEAAPHRIGPNLFGIVGQTAASQEGYQYSPALRESGLTWTKANLTAWVVATESMVPGTWMLYHNVLDAEELPALIEYIESRTSKQQP